MIDKQKKVSRGRKSKPAITLEYIREQYFKYHPSAGLRINPIARKDTRAIPPNTNEKPCPTYQTGDSTSLIVFPALCVNHWYKCPDVYLSDVT